MFCFAAFQLPDIPKHGGGLLPCATILIPAHKMPTHAPDNGGIQSPTCAAAHVGVVDVQSPVNGDGGVTSPDLMAIVNGVGTGSK